MNRYAIIDIGGKQLQVEPGRFHDTHNFGLIENMSKSDTKISINRVLLIRREDNIIIGHPWLKKATVRGRILHSCLSDKLVIRKIHSKKKTRRTNGYRNNLIRFVVDSIDFKSTSLNGSLL
uniref:Large ribosomal subunit protein bL21c n=1 Tax=Lindsaea linearis TaxID=641179 RepID=A0A5B9RL50_9MONI|nr:ribosomal protein L21 [Lindsaea linearis]QEG57395.1 ribosomal protein L21 [Lindsaea linearis]